VSAPPPIAAVAGSAARPWLSVMIPTWQPDVGFLRQAVESVLAALPADADVEITLVDDASQDFDASTFARSLPSGAVRAIRAAEHRGLAANWNACLAEARGYFVHLLHQDDFVLPGFYAALRRGFDADATVGAAYTASLLCGADGRGWAPRLVPMTAPGVLVDWPRHVFARLSIQCSAIVVRRTVYETLGGFDGAYRYALDWDMWRRIAVHHPLWFHPDPLAAYRMHPRSESARQQATGDHLVEIFRSIERSAALLPPAIAPRVLRAARFHYATYAVESALAARQATGRTADARRHLAIARSATGTATLVAALAAVAARGVIRAFGR
jgi:glycosyltransferase involved in cell wall biosynthesis